MHGDSCFSREAGALSAQPAECFGRASTHLRRPRERLEDGLRASDSVGRSVIIGLVLELLHGTLEVTS